MPPEEEEVKEAYADWAQEERSRFARDVAEAEAAHMAEKKSEKLTLAALVSVIDNLPAEVLKHHNLDKLLTSLKAMQKLPKKEKVQEIFGALNTIVLASEAVAAEQPQKDDEEKEEKENVEKEDGKDEEPNEEMKEE